MPVTTETAQVFRGGGRRWFSKGAAIHGEARAMYQAASKAKGRCDCDSGRGYGPGEEPGYMCKYHDHSDPVYGRYIRYAQHLIKKATP